MNGERWRAQHVYLYRDAVDFRKSIDGLCAIVGAELGRNPADRCLYVFTNRERNKIKLLVWHLNGYWLLYKRLDKQKFRWPDWFDAQSLVLQSEQLDYLLDGYDLNGMRPHRSIEYAHAF